MTTAVVEHRMNQEDRSAIYVDYKLSSSTAGAVEDNEADSRLNARRMSVSRSGRCKNRTQLRVKLPSQDQYRSFDDGTSSAVGNSAKAVVGNSSTPVVGNSATPVDGNSATPVVGNSSTPVVRNSSTPVVGNSATPVVGNSSTPVVGNSATPVVGNSATLVENLWIGRYSADVDRDGQPTPVGLLSGCLPSPNRTKIFRQASSPTVVSATNTQGIYRKISNTSPSVNIKQSVTLSSPMTSSSSMSPVASSEILSTSSPNKLTIFNESANDGDIESTAF